MDVAQNIDNKNMKQLLVILFQINCRPEKHLSILM